MYIFFRKHKNKSIEIYIKYSDNKIPRISRVSEKIHIDNNWTASKSAGICTGNSTYSEPYVIEDLVIDANNTGSCILIENSDVYFKIENCTLFNAIEVGIRLIYVNNSQLIGNNCSSNLIGIQLYNSTTNTISGNIANDNSYGIQLYYSTVNIISENIANDNYYGIHIENSDNNTISRNIANNNEYGISLGYSNDNNVSGNTANNNGYGIFLFESAYNTISGNTANNNGGGISLWNSDCNTISGNIFLGNDECIEENDCKDNIFENNDCGIIPGYNLFFLLGALSVAVILIIKKLKKS